MTALLGWFLWLALLPLLAASAFCSASETVLFGLTGADREWLRRERPVVSARVESLLSEPRGLLVTVLLANHTVNTIFFVLSNGMLLMLGLAWWAEFSVAVLCLLLLVVFGETLPKLAGNVGRRTLVGWIAGPLLLLHRTLGPVRTFLDVVIVTPLARLAGPPRLPSVATHELRELLHLSERSGVLAREEGETLRRVTQLGERRVREVMTPRVFLEWVRSDAAHAELVALARRSRRRRVVVASGDLDSVEGLLDLRSYLLDARGAHTPMRAHVMPARFVPELIAIDQLLVWFARTGQRVAIAVDEFGGTAGIVTLRDAIGEIGGRSAEPAGEGWVQRPDGSWTCPGDADLGEAFERFGEVEPDAVSDTVAGAIMARLGRVARVGDEVSIGRHRLRVESMTDARVDRVRWATEVVS